MALLLLTGVSGVRAAWATTGDVFKQVYRLYSTGAYAQAVEKLEQINLRQTSPEEKKTISYWRGLCFSKMQSFDQAVDAFQQAVVLGADFRDLQYELGQALYASQQLKPALSAFEKSAVLHYKVGASLYYKGFINQILEEFSVAISTYKAITRLPDDPDKVKEGSLLQIAELELNTAMAEKNDAKKKLRMAKRVIPAFEDVLNFNDSGPAADEARRSLAVLRPQLEDQTQSGPKFENGIPMPARPWFLRSSVDLKYDSNVLYQANGALISVSNTGSGVVKPDLDARYDFIFKKKYVLSPELDVNYTYNTNRTEPSVIANDQLSASFYARSRMEHKVLGAASAMSFDIECNYVLRDYTENNQLPFYSSYINFTYGNRVQFLALGSTSLNLNLKWFSSEDPGQNAFNPGIILSQNFNFGKLALSESFSYDFNSASNTSYNRIDYRLTSALNITDLFWQTFLSIALDLTLVNTEEQIALRGLEKTISPVLTLTKAFKSGFSVNVNFFYTNNISLDQEKYAYSKYVLGVGAAFKI
jgi:tetratricopeptide (TPR) repeat protein